MKTQISYIIATQNRAKILGRTLESLLKQDIDKWEAIIVDDHGDDNTLEIIKKYKDKRLKYFRLLDCHGRGASCARNFGIIQSQSPIIAILDSDDICYPSRSSLTLEAFDKDHLGSIFYANNDILEIETGKIRKRKMPFYPFSLNRLKKSNFIPHSTIAIKRETALVNPYNQFFKIAEDYELYIRLATSGAKFIYSPEIIVRRSYGEANLTHGDMANKLSFRYGFLARMIHGWAKYDHKIINEIEAIEASS